MRLSDIMSEAGLTIFPQVGLVLFLIAFAMIAARLYGRRRHADFDRWAAMALDEGEAAPGSPTALPVSSRARPRPSGALPGQCQTRVTP